ncbi:MAG: hypothetical protein IH984_03610 [Planctomycetes bacterium]|nr:hypothetical protein [Planctomycetota bacterium]
MSNNDNSSSRSKTALGLILTGAIISLVALVISLAKMHLDRSPTIEAGQANLHNLWPFWISSASCWIALTALWLYLRKSQQRNINFWAITIVIFLVAVSARIAVVLTHQPTLSDDIYRYIFDGRNLANSINPYLHAPAERLGLSTDEIMERPLGVLMESGVDLVDDEHWPGEAKLLPLINNPELHTIYLPTSQYVFAVAAFFISDAAADPQTSSRILRYVLIVIELFAIGLILLALKHADRSAWWAALYAWHPIAITEIAGSGHQDVIGVALMMLGLVMFSNVPKKVWQWTIALAVASLAKPVTIPLAAIMLKGQSWRRWFISGAVGGAVCIALCAPLLLTHNGQPLSNLIDTASRFSQKWAHFGSVYEPTMWTLSKVDPIEDEQTGWQKRESHEKIARLICLALVGIVIIAVFFSSLDVWASCRVILFAMVLFSSTAHPWYLLWALVILPRAPSPAVWIATLTLPWGYAQLGDVIDWTVPTWVIYAAYCPVYLALMIDIVMSYKKRTTLKKSIE